MNHILVYGDSLTWGIVPGTRERLPFERRWPGVMERELGTNDFQSTHANSAWHSSQGVAALVRAIRRAPIAVVARELDCAFFDAGTVVKPSAVDGVHLDAEAHGALGLQLARQVASLITSKVA